MHTINPKIAKIVSGISIAMIMLGSGFSSYYFYFKPLSDQPVISTNVSASDHHSEDSSMISENDYLATEEPGKVKYVRITADTYLRAKDSDHSDIIKLLKPGTEAPYVDESKSRFKISISETDDGWVSKNGSELFEKEVIIKHIPKRVKGESFDMTDTSEGQELKTIFKKYTTVGASIAIIKEGQIAYHYEYGYADRENNIPVNQNTKFRVASVSKVFTAMLAMKEVDEGKLSLDDNLSDLLGFRFNNPKYPDTPVTMRMLLTHTSGLSGKEGLYNGALCSAVVKESNYSAKPGKKFIYSNLGMGIAGAVVEIASDMTISKYASESLLKPMGIDASYDAKYLSDPSLVANCYTNGRLKRTNEVQTRTIETKNIKPGDIFYLGQGNLLISAIDLAKLSTLLLNDGQYDDKQYLSKDIVTAMLTEHPINTQGNFTQCIGIRKSENLVEGRDIYYHNGNYYGIYALMAIDPSDRSGVIVITSGANSQRNENTVFDVCNDIMNYCYKDLI